MCIYKTVIASALHTVFHPVFLVRLDPVFSQNNHGNQKCRPQLQVFENFMIYYKCSSLSKYVYFVCNIHSALLDVNYIRENVHLFTLSRKIVYSKMYLKKVQFKFDLNKPLPQCACYYYY